MSKESSVSRQSDQQRLAEAALWRARLTETHAETSEAFEAWLVSDPKNLAAWQEIQRSWNFFSEYANSAELIRERRSALGMVSTTSSQRWTKTKTSVTRTWLQAAAAAVVLMTAGTLLLWTAGKPDVYETAVGERRTVTLADGSQVALDSHSKLRVAFSDTTRELVLVRGQARFSVAHNPARPFVVLAAEHKVVATGTTFNIDVLEAKLVVTLLSGQVVVLPEAGDASTLPPFSERIELQVGDQLQTRRAAPPSVQRVNLENATAWEQGQMVLVDEPLSEVVMRISRYSARPVRIVDAQTAQLRISGVFDASDLDGFVATICSYLPIVADKRADGSIQLRPHPQPAVTQS